jgi:Domain of unknown function (DUF4214)
MKQKFLNRVIEQLSMKWTALFVCIGLGACAPTPGDLGNSSLKSSTPLLPTASSQTNSNGSSGTGTSSTSNSNSSGSTSNTSGNTSTSNGAGTTSGSNGSNNTTSTNTTSSVASNYDPYHPVLINFVNDDVNGCSSAATQAAGYSVTCTMGGGCSNANPSHYGACVFAPAPANNRSDANILSQIYQNSDANTPLALKAGALIRHLYQTVLNRDTDLAGYYFWLNTYFSNAADKSKPTLNPTLLANYVVTAPEDTRYQNAAKPLASRPAGSSSAYASMLYPALFGRQPDQSGLNFWTSQLDANQASADQVLAAFEQTAEYSSYMQSFGLPLN